MFALIASDPLFDKWIERHSSENDSWDDESRNKNVQRKRVTKNHGFKRWRHAHQSIEPAHIPIGLRPGRDLTGRVRTVEPERVNRCNSSEKSSDSKDNKEESAGLSHVNRHQRITNNVLLGATRAWVLRVLLVPDQHQVNSNES